MGYKKWKISGIVVLGFYVKVYVERIVLSGV